VLRTGEEPLTPEAELFVMLAARAQHVRQRILPRLDRGEVVLCDRYADASVAYQGGGRRLGLDRVAAANLLATGGIAPDLTVLFDLEVEDALRRVRTREHQGGEANRFDHEDIDFHEAVRRTYLELARREPDRFLVLATTGPRQDVARSILDELEPRLARLRQEGALV
jgi:dTMP kinase